MSDGEDAAILATQKHTCVLCGSAPADPVPMNCGHRACRACLRRAAALFRAAGGPEAAAEDDAEKAAVQCPVCGDSTVLAAKVLAPPSSQPPAAAAAPSKAAPAAAAVPHQPLRTQELVCPVHAGQPLTSYCFLDKVALCAQCAAAHAEAGHTVADVTGSADVARRKLAGLADAFSAHSAALQQQADAAAARAMARAERADQYRSAVTAFAERAKAAIDRVARALVEDATRHEDERARACWARERVLAALAQDAQEVAAEAAGAAGDTQACTLELFLRGAALWRVSQLYKRDAERVESAAAAAVAADQEEAAQEPLPDVPEGEPCTDAVKALFFPTNTAAARAEALAEAQNQQQEALHSKQQQQQQQQGGASAAAAPQAQATLARKAPKPPGALAALQAVRPLAGVRTVIAGSDGKGAFVDGAGTAARFSRPSEMTVDYGRRLVFVADTRNHCIRCVGLESGVTATVAGRAGTAGFADGAGAAALFSSPSGIFFEPDSGVLYVADRDNHCIRAVDPKRAYEVRTVCGAPREPGMRDAQIGSLARFCEPWGVVADSEGALYVADHGNNAIRRVDTRAGFATSTLPFANLNGPAAATLGRDGAVYVVEAEGRSVLCLPSGGTSAADVRVVLENPPQQQGVLSYPCAVHLDPTTNTLYIADWGANSIKLVPADSTGASALEQVRVLLLQGGATVPKPSCLGALPDKSLLVLNWHSLSVIQ